MTVLWMPCYTLNPLVFKENCHAIPASVGMFSQLYTMFVNTHDYMQIYAYEY